MFTEQTRALPGVARSDSHFHHDLWDLHTEIQASMDVEEASDAITDGNVKVFSAAGSIRF
jgi:hypothetical protein